MDKATSNLFKACRVMVCLIVFFGTVLGPDGVALAVGLPMIGAAIAGAVSMHRHGVKINWGSTSNMPNLDTPRR